MSDGIAWIGAHAATDASAALPGMLSLISLTAARGVDPDEFLIALGADLDELAARTPYKDLAALVRHPGRPSPRVNAALHAAGSVYPSLPDTDEAEVVAYYEEHGARLPEAVFTAIGSYSGLSIDQAAVQAGALPSVLIPMV